MMPALWSIGRLDERGDSLRFERCQLCARRRLRRVQGRAYCTTTPLVALRDEAYVTPPAAPPEYAATNRHEPRVVNVTV
jgi:hypothetical protein